MIIQQMIEDESLRSKSFKCRFLSPNVMKNRLRFLYVLFLSKFVPSMTFNMYWLHHSINLLKIVPFWWLVIRPVAGRPGRLAPSDRMVWQSDQRRRESVE